MACLMAAKLTSDVALALLGNTLPTCSNGSAKLMGRLAMPSLLAQAAAPSVGALLLENTAASGMLRTLAGLAVTNVALALLLAGLLGGGLYCPDRLLCKGPRRLRGRSPAKEIRSFERTSQCYKAQDNLLILLL